MKLYAVAKLLTKISYVEPIRRDEIEVELSGCAGYIPVFNTIKEAQEHTNNGKFHILELKVPDKEATDER